MSSHKRRGKSLVNSIINKLPVELHIPGYQYCGPGTKLDKRLARGDPGINPLDIACKEHDIVYSKNTDNIAVRNQADRVLADKAWSRVFAKDANFGEKAAAWGVANVMKIKSKFGMGANINEKKKRKKRSEGKATKHGKGSIRKRVKSQVKLKKTKKRTTTLRKIIQAAKSSIASHTTDDDNAIKTALEAAREAVKKAGGKENILLPRILPVPAKIGGILPFLIPMFAGLSATGALAGGAAGIVKAINDTSAGKRQLEETKRHNKTMEDIALGKGMYLKPYKKGLGLHLNPYTKNE